MLRAARRIAEPLIGFTPQEHVRHPDASSDIEDFTAAAIFAGGSGSRDSGCQADFVCQRKSGHELQAERKRRGDASTAICFLDQLYPLASPGDFGDLGRAPPGA